MDSSGLGDLFTQAGGLFASFCLTGIIALVFTGSGIYLLRRRRAAEKRAAESGSADAEPVPDIPAVTAPAAAEAQPAVQAESAPAKTSPAGASGGNVLKTIRNFFFYPEGEKEKPQEDAPDSPAEAAAIVTPTPAQTLAAAPVAQPMPSPGGYAMPQPPAAMPSDPADTVEIMRILRDVADGSLVIQFSGQYYRHIGEMRAAGQERRFVAVLRELARMAKDSGDPPEAAPPPPRAASQPAPEPPAAPPPRPAVAEAAPTPAPAPPQPAAAPTPPPQPVQQPVQQPAAPRTPPPAQGDKPTMKPLPSLEELQADITTPIPAGSLSSPEPDDDDEPIIGSFFDNVRKAVKTRGKSAKAMEEVPNLSVGEQIERYLQRKISAQPDFQGRDIHVRNGPTGGIVIQVDDQFFEGVGDITDGAARELVQSAVAEWESSLRQG